MCVKEFYGFSCGHCSVPVIVQCPLAMQNTNFPYCSFPAERAIQFAEYCHGCARAWWNMKVLEDEAEHKRRHEQDLCQCEVIFTEADKKRLGDLQQQQTRHQQTSTEDHIASHRQESTGNQELRQRFHAATNFQKELSQSSSPSVTGIGQKEFTVRRSASAPPY